MYTTYITKHSTAIEHLNSLPQTPALTAYLAHTSTLAQSLTHAWDLPSLLIKPVQRLLKYSLLLSAIIDETPDAHGDKANLRKARQRMEEVAHGVNEGRRRREVVKEVLMGVPISKAAEAKAKKKGLNVGIAASVNLGRIKSIRAASFKVKEGAEANDEAARVARLGEELRRTDAFMKQFAKDAVRWGRSMTLMMHELLKWAHSFGDVIGVHHESKSDAFDAFVELIEHGIIRACKDFEDALEYSILPQLTRLRDSASAPERLLEAMRTLEPLHYGLLNFNVAKSRPPPQLLEASKSYVALRAQLYAELPKYLELLDKGIQGVLRTFCHMQRKLWEKVRHQWLELWDALRMDEEERGAAEQTVVIWHQRFMPILEQVNGLNIVQKKDRDKEKERERERPPARARGRSFTGAIDTYSTTSTVVMATMASLDPHLMAPSRSSQTLVASPTSIKSRRLDRNPSTESLHSRQSGKSSKRHSGHEQSYNELIRQWQGRARPESPYLNDEPHPPISLPMPLRKSSSHGRLLDNSAEASSSAQSLHAAEPYGADDVRGRQQRKPGFKRRLTETLRASPSASSSRHRRSPSLPSMSSLNLQSPRPSPAQPAFELDPHDPALLQLPTLYECMVVFPLRPPHAVTYRGLPFFKLEIGEVYGIMVEEGHPSGFPDLPLKVDDGVDCLMMVRNFRGEIGWALASFLQPVP